MLSDQEFGNVYPLAPQGQTSAPGAVPDHVDRRVLYDLLAGRIARDPDFVGVSFCAVLYDQSHWGLTNDRGQPSFATSTASRSRDMWQRSATRINGSLMRFANPSTKRRLLSFTIRTSRLKLPTAVSWNSDLHR